MKRTLLISKEKCYILCRKQVKIKLYSIKNIINFFYTLFILSNCNQN